MMQARRDAEQKKKRIAARDLSISQQKAERERIKREKEKIKRDLLFANKEMNSVTTSVVSRDGGMSEVVETQANIRDLRIVRQKDPKIPSLDDLISRNKKSKPYLSDDDIKNLSTTQLIRLGLDSVKNMRRATTEDVAKRHKQIYDIRNDKSTSIVRKDDLLVKRYEVLAREKVNSQYPYLSDQDKKWATEVLVEEEIASESGRKLSGVNKNLQYSEYYRQKGNEKTAMIYAKRALKEIQKLGLSDQERGVVWRASSAKARENQERVAREKEKKDPRYQAGLEAVGMDMMRRESMTARIGEASVDYSDAVSPQAPARKGPTNQYRDRNFTQFDEQMLNLKLQYESSERAKPQEAKKRRAEALASDATSFLGGGELTAGSIAGLATLTRMANGGQTAQQQAATAAMYLGGGINVQRMYLNGRLMASDAKSQGNDQFFSKLKLQTTG